jgi:hypothetical protein
MLKQFILVRSSLLPVLMAPAVHAIAPGMDKIATCGNFTSDKYKVPGNQITVSIDRRTLLGYYLNWSIKQYRASGYYFVTHANHTTR